jgi:hypothetical protein
VVRIDPIRGVVLQVGVGVVLRDLRVAKGGIGTCCSSTLESGASAIGGGVAICSGGAASSSALLASVRAESRRA